MREDKPKVFIVGAGIGGLAAAVRLSHAGCAVTVLEAQSGPGGKMRVVPSAAGPVDAGPTVLTMKPVFEALFKDVGHRLSDHLTLEPLQTLARHYWPDGTMLDLMADRDETASNISNAFGSKAADEYRAFAAQTAVLYDAFEGPMMQTATPSRWALTKTVLRQPKLMTQMAPHQTMARLLQQRFSDPRLAQLFGRYATYVGGSPYQSPALLSLIADAEARGVWAVRGGMHQLAKTLMNLAQSFGTTFQFDTKVQRLVQQGGRVSGVETQSGQILADSVLFNGDPRALETGFLGQPAKDAVVKDATSPRSLSAYVGAFAAKPNGVALHHHTVFFADNPKAEFDALKIGHMPRDATLYLCAQDHGQVAPSAMQRFEVIMNAPSNPAEEKEEKDQCQTMIFARFRQFGLHFDPTPTAHHMTTPAGFNRLFPASLGSLYGRSPHGMMAAFKRPTARTTLRGLYLCGGGTHPGAGIPMATLSGKHAAEAILKDQTLTSTSHPTVTRGGTLTGSAIAEQKQSLL